MFVTILPLFFFAAEGLPFLSLTELKDCPNIPAQENVHIDQIAGSWRLAYLFYDEQDDLFEDGACIVTEFTPISRTQMNIATHMDVMEDDMVVDRSSLDLLASFHTPGEWLLHSNLSRKACLRVKVIALTTHHMILTFCISNTTNTDNYSNPEDFGYNYILQKLKSNDNIKYFRKNENNLSQDDELSTLFGRKKYFRKKRSFLEKFGEKTEGDSVVNDLKASGATEKKEKHFWTLVLAKDNNVSAYNFVEVATFLMKFGFDVQNGNLVSRSIFPQQLGSRSKSKKNQNGYLIGINNNTISSSPNLSETETSITHSCTFSEVWLHDPQCLTAQV